MDIHLTLIQYIHTMHIFSTWGWYVGDGDANDGDTGNEDRDMELLS